MDTSALEELGLSAAEAKIYLALLGNGAQKTGMIINTTGLQSSTVYHVIGSLVEKGLVSYVLKGKTKLYQAERPENFLLFLEEKKRKFSELLPVLKEKEKNVSQNLSAKVFEGINGLKAAFNDIIISMKPGEEYCFFQSPKENLFNKTVILFFKNYHLKRAEKGIKVKGLALEENKPIVKKIFEGIKNTKIRYLSEFTPSGVVIYKNKLITLDWDQTPTAFVIESEAVTRSYRKFFEQKWAQAKP